MTAQGLLPIHHQAPELIMPGMRALHLPPPGLPPGLRWRIVAPTALGSNMPDIFFLQHDAAGRGIVKGRIQTQGGGWDTVGWGRTIGALVSNVDNRGLSLTLAAGATLLTGTPRPSTSKWSL